MIYGITDLTTFVLGAIFIVLLPGPNSLVVMTLASRQGAAAGYWAAGGIVVGDTILMLLAATGMASLLYTSALVFTVLKYAGAAYLGWLGIGLLRDAVRHWRHHAQPPAHTKPQYRPADARPFITALVISLLNPKAIMFFISFFIQFVDPGYATPWLSFLILGLIVQVLSIIYLYALIVGGVKLTAQLGQRRWLAAAATGATGLIFIGFAARLASTGLSS